MIGERIAKARKDAGYSDQKALSSVIKVGARTLADYETNNSEPKASTLKLIAENCNVTTDWLLFGDENSLPTISNKSVSADVVSINYYENIHASAGYGSLNGDFVPIKMEFDKNFLESIMNIRRFDNLDIIRVTGDSMLPYIKDGEYILVERESDAKSGDTVIAIIDGELYIKRLKKVPFEKWLTLESENNEYPSIELDTQEKLEAFTIVGVMRSKIKLY